MRGIDFVVVPGVGGTVFVRQPDDVRAMVDLGSRAATF
jgi:hypothetical protein